MTLSIVAFFAGVLTVLAPCILPLLPIILGGSLSSGAQRRSAPYVIVASLSVSVIVFTILLKVSTAFIAIPDIFWKTLSSSMLIVIGLSMLFPGIWQRISAHLPKSGGTAQRAIVQGTQKRSLYGDIVIGAALGPVFSSCSPTYLAIVGIILPESFAVGFVYLIAYTVGLATTLLLIALLGQRILKRFMSLARPNSFFKRVFGIVFVIVGIALFTGFDKDLESKLIQSGAYDRIGGFEQHLLERVGL